MPIIRRGEGKTLSIPLASPTFFPSPNDKYYNKPSLRPPLRSANHGHQAGDSRRRSQMRANDSELTEAMSFYLWSVDASVVFCHTWQPSYLVKSRQPYTCLILIRFMFNSYKHIYGACLNCLQHPARTAHHHLQEVMHVMNASNCFLVEYVSCGLSHIGYIFSSQEL